MSGSVLFETKDAVAVLTINRPHAFNALNEGIFSKFTAAVDQCQDNRVRAVMITGSGRAFCAGGDLREMLSEGRERLPELLGGMSKPFHELVKKIRLLPKPVLAAVNGPASGGGLSLALACDLRLAAKSARFRQAYTGMGFCPDGGLSVMLPALLGFGKSSEMFFLDPVLTAEEAAAAGLVQAVFADEEFSQKAWQVAQKLAAGPTQSYAWTKMLLNRMLLPLLEQQLDLECSGMSAAGRTADAWEGINAFAQKTAPVFTGK